VNKRSVKKLGLSLIAFLLLFSTAFSTTGIAATDKKEKASSALTDKGKKMQTQTKATNKKDGSIKDRISAKEASDKNTKKIKKSKTEKQATKPATKTTKSDTKKVATTATKQTTKSDFLKQQRKEAMTDEIIVKFKPNVSATAVKDKLALKTVKKLNSIGAEVIKVPKGKNANNIIGALKADPSVLYAQPNYKYYPRTLPNDSLYSNLWGLHNEGQFEFTHDMDIDLPEALGVFNGSTSEELVIGVIDTGIDINHPDLQQNIWTNPNEIANNGIDDDRNGYIDDVNGWDFYHFDNTVYDANDLDEHGTHVAGTIAAVANNSTGVAGIAPNVKIMPLKFLGPDGGSTSDAILAIEYAAKMGVKVTNNSWGGGPFEQALYDAIKNSNSLFVAAAGNDGLDNDVEPSYPDSYDLDNIISVAAINGYGHLAGFSNYGNYSVDIAAPGEFIQSTVPKKNEFGAAAEINNGTYKAIFNGFGLENIADETQKLEAFQKAMAFLGATPESSILLVQDDQSDTGEFTNYLSDYKNLLETSGYTSVTHQVLIDQSGPDAATLATYDIVIWFTGQAFGYFEPTLTSDDLQSLTSYLQGGGNLLLSGQDLLWRNTETPFALNTLGLNIVGEQERTDAVGVANTIYDGMAFPIDGAYYADLLFTNNATTTKVNFIYPADENYDQAFEFFNGTSMAAPHVTGVAALIYGLNPSISPTQAKNILMSSGDPLDSLTGKVLSGNKLNAYNALTFDPTTLDNEVPGVALTSDVVTESLDANTDTDDVFALKLNKGETIKATLTGDAGTDFDLYLFDPYSTTVQDSTGMLVYSESENSSEEYIEFTAFSTDTYYLDVYAFAGSGNYTLTVSIGNGPGEYENTSPSIYYEGHWPIIENTLHSGGNAQSTNYYGSLSFSFIGDEIEWFGYKDTNQGFADVYIDDKFIESISLYSSTLKTKVSLLNKKVPYGKHILEIVWTGKRDPLARKSGTSINVDKLIVRENLVPPQAPTDLKVNYDVTHLAPMLKWNASTDANGYKVYRKEANETGYTALNTTLITGTQYVDRTAKAGFNYQYYVTAVGTKNLESVESNNVSYLYDDNAPGVPMAGTSVTGSLLEFGDDVDVWSVKLDAGKTYNFSFNGPSGTDFDYALYNVDTTNVYPETVEPLRLVEEIGSEEYFTYPVTVSGTYYVVAYTYEGSGEYSIKLGNKTTVADDDIPVAIPLTTNQASDFLDPYDIDDVYSVELGKGDTITVNLSTTAKNGNDFDLYLYGPNSTTVNPGPNYIDSVVYSANEDTSTETVTYVADVAGKYYIDVNWFKGTGLYSINLVIKRESIGEFNLIKIEENDSKINYSGSWTIVSNTKYSGGIAKAGTSIGSTAEYTFNGTGIKVFGATSSNRGKTDIYIDGILYKTVDLYSPSINYNVLYFEDNNLSNGPHTIKIVNKGERNPASTGIAISLDYIEIRVPVSLVKTIIEENNTQINYSGSWINVTNSKYSGGVAKAGTTIGSAASYYFIGTGIKVIGATSNNRGKADIYIDGVLYDTVDLYSPSISYNVVYFEENNLLNSPHTIKIVNKGERNSSSSGNTISLDYFEVYAPNSSQLE
jgi:subtilisin family serine protease